MFKRPETVEEMQAIRAKARERSFADLAEADELESILFKTFVVAAEQMDAVELLRKDGNKSWTSKISSVRVGFWKAYEGWTNFAHPELLAKPQLPKAGKKGKSADEDDDDEPEEEYVPDLTWPTEPVAWRDLLVWKSSENYPLVRDTNITARHIMALFDEEIPLVDIMKAYPFLNMRDIAACQAFWDEEVPARKEYEEKYFDKQWMSPLHPEFVKAPSYPKTPKPPGPVVPGGAPIGNTNKNDGPMTLPTRRGATIPAILLLILAGLMFLVGVAFGLRGVSKHERERGKIEVLHDWIKPDGRRLSNPASSNSFGVSRGFWDWRIRTGATPRTIEVERTPEVRRIRGATRCSATRLVWSISACRRNVGARFSRA